jgi:hypothetical protein
MFVAAQGGDTGHSGQGSILQGVKTTIWYFGLADQAMMEFYFFQK